MFVKHNTGCNITAICNHIHSNKILNRKNYYSCINLILEFIFIYKQPITTYTLEK